MSFAQGTMGFQGLKIPTGYGAVKLKAKVNGIDVGDAWSKKTTYSQGTEHAEDAVVDYIECLEMSVEFSINMLKNPGDLPVIQSMQLNKFNKKGNTLVIENLTASPCSKTLGTCDKPDMVGCAERLIELTKRGWTVSVSADHYYQPQGVVDAKNLSKQAAQAMEKAGITVVIANQ